MWAVFIVLVLSAAVILMVGWDRRTGLLDPKRFREAPLIPTRKQRFAEYVRGLRLVMAEWEEAFGTGPVSPEPDTFDAYIRRQIAQYKAISTGVYGARKEYRCFDGWSQAFPCTADEFNAQQERMHA